MNRLHGTCVGFQLLLMGRDIVKYHIYWHITQNNAIVILFIKSILIVLCY